jgi:hypothetical protein
LRDKGYLTELRPYYIRMLRCGRRQPRKEMNDHLLEFREPPITEEEFREYTSQSQGFPHPHIHSPDGLGGG